MLHSIVISYNLILVEDNDDDITVKCIEEYSWIITGGPTQTNKGGRRTECESDHLE